MTAPVLLILDLDETLIHASAAKIREDFDFQVYQYYVYKDVVKALKRVLNGLPGLPVLRL